MIKFGSCESVTNVSHMIISIKKLKTKIHNISAEKNITHLRRCLEGRAKDALHPLLMYPEDVNKLIESMKNHLWKT